MRYVGNVDMGMLFDISTSRDNSLEVRYTAARTMQALNENRKKLSKNELEVYLAYLMYGKSDLPVRLNMTKDVVTAALNRIRSKGYEVM